MATKTVTKSYRKLVVQLSIPVSELTDGAAAAGCQKQRDAPQSNDGTKCGRTTDPTSVNRGRNNDLELQRNSATPNSSSSERSYEGDRINPIRFRRMAPIPQQARCRLLLAVEPFDLGPREMLRGFFDRDEAKPSGDGEKAQGVTEDFCVRFSRDLLRKLRDSAASLRHLAKRNCSWLFVKKTLLLRGSRRTNTWTKYLMCRVCSCQRLLLNRFIRALEQFEPQFGSRYPCKAKQPRVTLVPNKTVPENTALRMTRQRLHRSDNYFGKMPLLPDPFYSNLTAQLTSDCIQESATLAQLVEFV